MVDFLEDKKREITQRLKELEPLVDEYRGLEAAARALEGVGNASSSSAPRPTRRRARGAQAAAGGRASSGGTGRRGRPRGTGSRATANAATRPRTAWHHHR